MVTSKLIYNLSAALRILKAKFGNVVKVEKIRFFNGAVHVVYVIKFGNYSQRWSIFLSPKSFKVEFAEFRKGQASEMHVTSITNNLYMVRSTSGNKYHIAITQDAVECHCEDYKSQIAILSKGCCKHAYAVLGTLGFNSLRDFLAT